MDDSCIMCADCFYATDHTGHVVTFCISQQPGGSCDCGDPEVWRHPIKCPYHQDDNGGQTDDSKTEKPSAVTQALRDHLSRVIGCALDFILDVLDYSPEDTPLPNTYEGIMAQTSADPLKKEFWATVLWNDEKHSFDEIVAHLQHMTGCTLQQATDVVMRTDEEVRIINKHRSCIL
jgi:E3 ubiquitin-protein ligase UBR1